MRVLTSRRRRRRRRAEDGEWPEWPPWWAKSVSAVADGAGWPGSGMSDVMRSVAWGSGEAALTGTGEAADEIGGSSEAVAAEEVALSREDHVGRAGRVHSPVFAEDSASLSQSTGRAPAPVEAADRRAGLGPAGAAAAAEGEAAGEAEAADGAERAGSAERTEAADRAEAAERAGAAERAEVADDAERAGSADRAEAAERDWAAARLAERVDGADASEEPAGEPAGEPPDALRLTAPARSTDSARSRADHVGWVGRAHSPVLAEDSDSLSQSTDGEPDAAERGREAERSRAPERDRSPDLDGEAEGSADGAERAGAADDAERAGSADRAEAEERDWAADRADVAERDGVPAARLAERVDGADASEEPAGEPAGEPPDALRLTAPARSTDSARSRADHVGWVGRAHSPVLAEDSDSLSQSTDGEPDAAERGREAERSRTGAAGRGEAGSAAREAAERLRGSAGCCVARADGTARRRAGAALSSEGRAEGVVPEREAERDVGSGSVERAGEAERAREARRAGAVVSPEGDGVTRPLGSGAVVSVDRSRDGRSAGPSAR